MIFRPATPGFIVTLTATILLAVVSFNVPILKSVYFLKASLTVQNVEGSILLGTLGYCLELSNGTTCSKPSIGYEFDPNKLLGDNISFAQIPQVVVKWITYALFLHIIALCAAGLSAFFGLLAHVREMSMTCCSSCISGFAAVITLVAFIFDIVFFFLVKTRINKVQGGSATIGIAIWLTLAAWVLLFFSGCFYAFGRCCINRRARGPRGDPRLDNTWMSKFSGRSNEDGYTDQMRLDAVKAEADRKARQKNEVGLPAFPEYDATKPLNSSSGPQYLEEESDDDGAAPYRDHRAAGGGTAVAAAAAIPGAYPRRQGSGATQQNAYRGGYAQAAPGTRAVDEYYAQSPVRTEANTGYPPNRQNTRTTSPPASTYSRSNYSQSTYSAAPTAVAAPTPANQYLAVGGQSGHSQYPSGREYGHTNSGTTYHSAVSSQHQQQPSNYAQYNDPYSQPNQPQNKFNPDSYNQTGAIAGVLANPYGASSSPTPAHSTSPPPRQPSVQRQPTQPYAVDAAGSQYYTPPQSNTPGQPGYDYYGYGANGYGANIVPEPQVIGAHQPERSYTLGGGGYGGNVVPENAEPYGVAYSTQYEPGRAYTNSPPQVPSPISTNAVAPRSATSPVGPRSANAYAGASPALPQPQHSQEYEDSPPGYDAGTSQPAGQWDSKGPRA